MRFKRFLFIFSLMIPTLGLVGILSFYPTLKGIILSFQNYTVFTFNRIEFIGFDNYIEVFEDPVFPEIVKNTIFWILFSVLFQFLLGFSLALLMWKPFRGRGIYSGLVFYPWALSGFAIGLVWSWLLNGQFGVVNDLLMKLHIIRNNINFLSDPKKALFSVILVNVWYGIPFFAIMILAALQSIPRSLLESADIDGANSITKLFKIVIPYIKPTIVNTILLRIIWVMNFPDIIYGMTRGGPADSTNILSVYMINIAYYESNFSKSSAVGVIILSILFIYTTFYLKITSKGEFEI